MAALVGNIVGAARKAVDDLDRLAQAKTEYEQGGNREIFVVIDRHGRRLQSVLKCGAACPGGEIGERRTRFGFWRRRCGGSSPFLGTIKQLRMFLYSLNPLQAGFCWLFVARLTDFRPNSGFLQKMKTGSLR